MKNLTSPERQNNPYFWEDLQELLKRSDIIIDRPRGFIHPDYPDFTYPLDYGYLAGTGGSDGAEVDIWLGSTEDITLNGILCTTDTRKKEAEIKLICSCTPQEISLLWQINNQEGMHAIYIPCPFENPIRKRPHTERA
ncbi:inorganic pyrophosphatase [Spirochaetia bacterium 38H-sp]|uniref:Inorganic pyrophosphatase n=1 Tax=Rarispira pelagica TaxID=3141764 RepID=A0ABU9UA36_9SPIR